MLEVSPGWHHLCITPSNIVQVIAPIPESSQHADHTYGRTVRERVPPQFGAAPPSPPHVGAQVLPRVGTQPRPQVDTEPLPRVSTARPSQAPLGSASNQSAEARVDALPRSNGQVCGSSGVLRLNPDMALLLEGDDEQDAELADMLDELDQQMG